MTGTLWETLLLLSGFLLIFVAGLNRSAVIISTFPSEPNFTATPSSSSSGMTDYTGVATANTPAEYPSFTASFKESLINVTQNPEVSTQAGTASASNSSTPGGSNSSGATSSGKQDGSVTNHPVKKFVAAAVRSHFDDCPDSHRHFCFHGTCRFLVQEETPACVCHPGFVGLRCEHADLLAVVATNHRQQTVATVLVLCVVGCVLIMVLCSVLHCWWRQECQRRRHAPYYIEEKHAAAAFPSESVV